MRVTRGILTALLLVVGTTTLVAEGPAGAAPSECPGATIVGTAGDDTLRGTEGDDVIDGRGGNDLVLGLGGDDVLCGGGGKDRLRGGPGNDTLRGGSDAKEAEDTDYYLYFGDVLDGGPGDDVLDPGTDPRHDGSVDTVTFARATRGITADVAAGTVTGDGADSLAGPFATVVGSAHDDVMRGADGPDTLVGSGGHDVLVGRGGADLLAGGSWGTGREDRVGNLLRGGPGHDELHGSKGDDVVRGGPGNDSVQDEGGGRDRAWGGAGNDSFSDLVLPGGGQAIHGGRGRDGLFALGYADSRGRELRPLSGLTDLRRGVTRARFVDATIAMPTTGIEDVEPPRAKRWTVRGTLGPNRILAESHTAVRFYGLAGDDSLFGSFKDDVLDGGPGHDDGSGYVGHDTIRSIERIYR